jgi:undecaprenyl-diphosphatase
MFIPFVMGLVEGATEFIPVSSTGHLIVAGHLLGFTGEKASTFEIFIQMGAILAVLVLYASRFYGFFKFNDRTGFTGLRGISLLVLTTLPALVIGFLLHSWIKEHLFNPVSVAVGLIAGGIWILIAERSRQHRSITSLDSISWKQALGIGFFQCLAMWPGFSRSGATILGGMSLGFDRKTAAEYSFFAAVPVLSAAALLDLVKSLDTLSSSDIPFFGVGFLVSFVSAWIVIKFFIGFVSRHSLSVFAWYRFAAAAAILILLR